MDAETAADSARIFVHHRWWRTRPESRGLWVLLLLTGVVAVTAGLLGAVRKVGEFQRLDIRTVATPQGFLVTGVAPRSGGARAGLIRGDTIVAVDGAPFGAVARLDEALHARPVSMLDVLRSGARRTVTYYPPVPRVDVRYLLVAFAAMFTLVVAGLVYLGHPTGHAGRFLGLAQALFLAVVIPAPEQLEGSWQILLLLRDFGRLALPPLLVIFFATFPRHILTSTWQVVAFVPSLAVAVMRTGLAGSWLPPVVGNILLPEALDAATAALAVVGVVVAAGLGLGSYLSSRDDPTRRRQVEWVALGAAAGFAPYLLLSLLPQLAGAELEVLTWIALLPLALVPLGVASSLLEFRLWDLEDISRHVVSTGVAVLFGGVTFALLNYAITEIGFRLGHWRNLLAVAGGVLLAALTVPLRRLLLEGLERLQYRERLAARRALTTFAEEAAGHRDPEGLLLRLGQLLRDALGVDQVVTYLAEGGTLVALPAGAGAPLLPAESIKGAFPAEVERPLLALGMWHRFPLERDGRMIGVVYTSRRQGGLPLGHGERRLVAALAAQAALALENTLLLKDLHRQVEEHRLLEAYLERIFQSSAAALLICDSRGRILRANERASALLRRSARDLAGRSLGSLVDLPADWNAALPTDSPGIQVRFAGAGEQRTGLLSTSALEVEPGQFDGRVVALDDISDQLMLEQRFAQQERLAALGRLAAGLAHEVNTPVTGIASYAQLLNELTPSDDPRAPLVEKLEEQAFRVARIVTNLLELARPSGFERAPVDLGAVAREEVGQMRSEAARTGIEISCQVTGAPVVSGNRVQLELVVHNLVRNALQATPAGGVVAVSAGHRDDVAWLEVADSGGGISSDVADRVFEPFVTTRQERGGTGLGLAITRDIVQAHGGAISAQPNTPHGTVVRVELPALGASDANPDH